MKTKILDTPIIENIQDLLTTGECIVWEGVPNPSKTSTILEIESKASFYRFDYGHGHPIFITVLFLLLGLFFTYHYEFLFGFSFLLTGLATLILPEIFKNKRKQNTKYFITSKRIIFELWWYGKKSFHQIEFSNLQNIIISERENKNGVIYFVVKNPKTIDFTTYCFSKGERRHQPTFETIENVNEVAQLIREHVTKKVHS